jgi:hypothetical protein
MANVTDISMQDIHRDVRKRAAARLGPMEFRCGIFDFNDPDSRSKYEELVTAEGHDGSGKVQISMRKDRWTADGRMLLAASWWQPEGDGDKYTPEPIDLVRNAVLSRGD